jgi:succinate dehydrogenase/fumarate reductase cytochrome b subunit
MDWGFMKNINGKEIKLSRKNKIVAFVLLPLYMISVFLISYTVGLEIASKWYDSMAIITFIIAILVLCVILNPIFNAFDFYDIYVVNGDLSLKEKMKKFKAAFITFTLISVVAGLWGGII